MLILTGCAVPAWQPPDGHPADLDAHPGVRTPGSALERYYNALPAAVAAPPSEIDGTGHPGRMHPDGDQGFNRTNGKDQ